MSVSLEGQIVDDIRRVATDLGRLPGQALGRDEYLRNGGRFSHYQLYEGGRSYDYYCSKAGYRTKAAVPVSEEGYYERLRNFVDKYKRLPKSSEKKMAGISNACVRLGGLQRFIELAIERGVIPDLRPQEPTIPQPPVSSEGHAHTSVSSVQRVPTSQSPSTPPPPIPARTRRKKWSRIDVPGFPYAPQDELSVVALFGILCANGTLPFDILEMNGGKGIDAICFDREKRIEARVELKKVLSRSTWNHDVDDIDYVVCWENRYKGFPKPVIELCMLFANVKRGG